MTKGIGRRHVRDEHHAPSAATTDEGGQSTCVPHRTAAPLVEPIAVRHRFEGEAHRNPVANGADEEVHHRYVAPKRLDPLVEPIADHRQHSPESQQTDAMAGVDEGGLRPRAHHISAAPLAEPIRQDWLMRRQWHSAEKSLTLQMTAVCRRFVQGDKDAARAMLARVEKGKAEPGDAGAILCVMPLLEARALLADKRDALEKQLLKRVRELPVWPWAKAQRGVGELIVAGIVGECGDLANYATVSRLWKRLGLAVIGGERQRRMKDATLALEHGYSPTRRSVAWNIGECLVKANREGDHWREVYLAEKTRQALLHPELTKAHVNNRAKRYLTKRFLAAFWAAWRAAATKHLEPPTSLPPPKKSAAHGKVKPRSSLRR